MGEKWWKLANGVQRGCYLQLLLLCKDGADNGHLCYRNVMELSVLFSIDRRTTYKVLTFLSQNCCINVEYEDSGMVNIFIPKYKFYQDLDAKSHAKHIASKRAKPPRKSALLNQTKPDQTRPVGGAPSGDHQTAIDYFYEKYKDHYGFDYDFQGKKDGATISRMLKRWKLEGLKILIDQLFESTDSFYEKGGGRTIGVLTACVNKLAQEAQRRFKGQDKLSTAGEATARAAARILEQGCKKKTKQLSSPS